MAARAMRNFGLTDLRLIAPRDGWTVDGAGMQAAKDAAAGAGDIVAGAPVYPDIPSAVRDLSRLYATTARERGQGKPVVTPAAEMPLIHHRISAGQGVGILFGAERTGLTNDEVSYADAVMSFPVDPGFASLNLAQAVLLISYDWRKAAFGDVSPIAAPPPDAPASREAVMALFASLETALTAAGYFSAPEKKDVMTQNLRNIIHRLAAGEQDVRTLHRVVRALSEKGSRQ